MTEVERYEPVPAQDGDRPGVEQLVLRWLITMDSPHTRHSYGLDLGVPPPPGESRAPGWLPFCAAAGIDPLTVRREHIALWTRGLQQAGLSPATVARKMSAVSSWYDWLADDGYVPSNPAKRLKRPKVNPDTSKTPGMTKDQALAFLAAADTAPWPQQQRNSALAALLLFTGARVSEACGTTLADLGMDRGHRVLWVTRKGGERQALVLPPPVLERIDAYLAGRSDLSRLPAVRGTAGRDRPLITTATGKRMLPADVWRLVRRIARAAGLPAELVNRMGAHSMRHSFATLTLDAGGNIIDLQDAMGHKDPRTTRRYDRARGRLDRSPGYLLATYLASDDPA